LDGGREADFGAAAAVVAVGDGDGAAAAAVIGVAYELGGVDGGSG